MYMHIPSDGLHRTYMYMYVCSTCTFYCQYLVSIEEGHDRRSWHLAQAQQATSTVQQTYASPLNAIRVKALSLVCVSLSETRTKRLMGDPWNPTMQCNNKQSGAGRCTFWSQMLWPNCTLRTGNTGKHGVCTALGNAELLLKQLASIGNFRTLLWCKEW